MDRIEEEGAGPEEAYFCGEGMSALFEEGSSAPVDEEDKDSVCSKKEQDNQKLADENKSCHGPIEGGKDDGVCERGDTGGEGGRHANARWMSRDGSRSEEGEVDPTRLAVLLAIKVFGTNAARVAQAERERDLFLAVFGQPTDQQKGDALLNAAERGDLWALSVLLDDGVHPDGPYRQGTTALMTAAKFGHLSCVKLLLTRGASINAQDHLRYTALHYAAEGEHAWSTSSIIAHGAEDEPTLSVVSALLDAGADKTMTNIHGHVAWQSATMGGHNLGRHIFNPSPVMTLLRGDGVVLGKNTRTESLGPQLNPTLDESVVDKGLATQATTKSVVDKGCSASYKSTHFRAGGGKNAGYDSLDNNASITDRHPDEESVVLSQPSNLVIQGTKD